MVLKDIIAMQDKFSEFCRKYENFMYYIANDVLKDSYAAEDAVQVALMKIYRNFRGVGDIDSVKTKHFVVTVTRRAAIDIYRKRQKQKEREVSCGDFEHNVQTEQDEILTENNEVMECIEKLPQKYADALVLKFVHGYKSKEIARILGYTPGTIRSYIFRGKKLLRTELKESGIDIKV